MPMNELNFEEKPENEKEPRSLPVQSGLGRNQKIAIAVLAVFAVFVVFLWSVQFKRSLSGAKYVPAGNETGVLSDNSGAEDLSTKDTDGDGLSDGDEINTYKTSPYLE